MIKTHRALIIIIGVALLISMGIVWWLPSDVTETIEEVAQTESHPDHPVIYVSVASHNEDTLSPNYPNYVEEEIEFRKSRALVVQFADMLYEMGVEYNFQTDWNFLLGMLEHDNGTRSTNGKNLLEYLVEDLDFSVDPHSHQQLGYNYADVAYLIDALGVEPSGVVGGSLVKPVADSIFEDFWKPIKANRYDYVWKAEMLWGGGTAMHIDEEDVWVSGVWRPQDKEHFTTHDPDAPLPDVGNFQSNWDGLELLVEMLEDGELYADQMYTITVMLGQHRMNDDSIADFQEEIEKYAELTEQGYIEWVTIQEALEIWETQYDSYGAIMLYDGTHIRP